MLVYVSAAAAPLSAQLAQPSCPFSTMGAMFWDLGGMVPDRIWPFPSLLQEVRQQLNSDHRDKMETLDIDRGCLSLNLKSPNISLKVNPTRVPNG